MRRVRFVSYSKSFSKLECGLFGYDFRDTRAVVALGGWLPIKADSTPLVFGERAHVRPRSRPRRGCVTDRAK